MNSSYSIKDKFKKYQDNQEQAKEWFESNYENLKQFFENKKVRDFIFEPFKDIFNISDSTIDRDIYAIITQVAIINAVLAGIPGQMGIGVYVSMALEAWMAYAIAKHLGIKFKKPSDVFEHFGLLASVGVTVFFIFKHLLSFMFSLISTVLPFVNPLMFAELLVTNFVGVLFWIGFEEMKKNRKFKIPKKTFLTLGKRTKEIFLHQWRVLKNTISLENIKLVGRRLKQWISGDFITEQKVLNGEIFANVAMAYLLTEQYDKLEGPLGEVFLEAIRLRWSSQLGEDATIQEIAERFREYSPEQLEGVINTVKGKMFEIMVTNAENTDNDVWQAYMHEDESYPGSDIIFTNSDTGESLEVSLKATGAENTSIIEHALDKYPDIPIMTTDEVAELYPDNPMVFGSGIEHEELKNITEDNIDELINSIEQVDVNHVILGGFTVGLVAAIWPFTMAYKRNKISYESYEKAIIKILGDSGKTLIIRLAYVATFGELFAWYLLARGVKLIVNGMDGTVYSKKLIVKY